MPWDGFANTRGLGGLPLRGGGTTTAGVFRSATLRFVTPAGWDDAWVAGVRTVLDLRNDDELVPRADAPLPGSAVFRDAPTTAAPPSEMDRVRVPLDDVDDVALWDEIRSSGLDGTPLYYPLFAARKPERCADAVRAVARARPGGIVFHCGAGRDRTGLLALLLLSLAGVSREAIADDYAEAARTVPSVLAAIGAPDQDALIDASLRRHGTTVHSAALDAVDRIDAEAVLREGGLTDDEITATRARFSSHFNV
ncbi:tyrosine-protein phosphatase [Pseudonocardia endophytica]|uniref:tyrosine-protein phosphatase n=1 Tax=Pseudonocardia endophytica TaxID=401976 RepID=UPI0010522116|nr:tyrosine-protein phosphatase [Pseudonocardia endophytica]